jgi:hypothetical protein
VLIFAAAVLVLGLVAGIRGKSASRFGSGLLVAVGSLAVAVVMSQGHRSAEGVFRLAALVTALLLLLTRGCPWVLLIPRQMKAREYRRLPKAERRRVAHEQQLQGQAHLGLIAFIILAVALNAIWPWVDDPFS